jgi:hypothetical protein
MIKMNDRNSRVQIAVSWSVYMMIGTRSAGKWCALNMRPGPWPPTGWHDS